MMNKTVRKWSRPLVLAVGLLLSFIANSQWTNSSSRIRYLVGTAYGCRDTASFTNPADTNIVMLQCSDSAFYVKYKGPWKKIATNGDMAGKLNISDTSSMLTPYLRKSDTTTMLVPYLRKTDTATMLVSYLRKSDTAAMLTPYIRYGGVILAPSSTSYTVAAGDIIDKVLIYDPSTITVSIGTAAGLRNIIPSAYVTAGTYSTFILARFSPASSTIYFNGITASSIIKIFKQ